ncbi:SUMF1/EgtB/PvdO family nonheme iron enzyme [Sedimenticola selenatireducens]|uniref:SUMF1/EgtB/PvdOfamily nonheme iron enzyme n=1 Tax=Sedimenticola selenatireducens TaxID=191960 RepID=A0A558DTR0_9GAMM|nr:SUMF1/EgtB/PvdO family nonheme iron enzyme [Sedimenticola selenatireducens]TVO76998.1 SUMF1/EgtB/PvdOfamily nonheme iron enzyme [Sedimenticola selenatireducens]TVT64441.1 MAG: SUMF1/EgtB/PvdOfamily nonheme iron enzyme [Sedimenticola selenatireducens]
MAVVPKQNGLDILRKLVPLNTLTEDTLAELMDSVEFEKVAKGDTIFNAGDTDPERIYLLSGKLGVIEAGKEIDTVAAGTNMARYPVAHHIPRKYSVQAKTKVEVVRIGNRLLSDLLSRGGNALYQVEELNTDSEDDWMSQLLLSPIFQRIPAANIQNIMMRMEEVQVTAGEVVIRQGDEGDYFYLINRGQCSITKEGRSGDLTELATLGPGDSVGEESLLSGQKRGSTVSMMTDGILFRLGKKDFIEYIKLPLANSISYDIAKEKVAKGAVWLDVRSALEFERAHIPQSKNIPFNELRSKLSGLDSSKTYVVYCQDGLVSSTAIYLLMERDLDGFVLERGLESVPDDVINKEPVQDGAQIINLRPEQEETKVAPPDSKTAPDDEAGLLRQRLQKTEAQAQEQLQRARKMKLAMEKLKGRLTEMEEEGEREGKERQRLVTEIESLQNRLRDRDEAHGALKQKQSAVNEQLGELKAERDQLQEELTKQCQHVGKLEKRLEGKQQEEDALKKALTEGSEKHQQALTTLQAKFNEEALARSNLDEQSRSLQQTLEKSNAEIENLKSELQARDTSIIELQQSEQALQEGKRVLESDQAALQGELDKARVEIDRLSSDLQSKGQSIDALEQQQQVLGETQVELDRLNAELQVRDKTIQQLQHNQQLLETAQAEITALESARSKLESEGEALQSGLEQARDEVHRLTDEIASHSKQNEAQASKLEQLEAALKEAQDAVNTLQAEHAHVGESEQSLQVSLSKAESRIAVLESDLSNQGSNNNKLTEQLAVAEKQQLLLNSELDQLRAELEGTSAQVSQLESERTELEKIHQQHKTELESTLKQSLYEAIEGRTQAEHGILSVTDERDRLAAELTVLKTAHSQLQQQLLTREKDFAELDAKGSVEEGEALQSSKAEQARLEASLAEATTALASLQQTIEAKDQELATLVQSLNERQEEEAHASVRLSEVESAVTTLQDDAQAQAELLALMEAEKQRLEKVHEDDQKQIKALEARLAQDKAEGQYSQDELSGLRVELEELAAAKMAAEEALARAEQRKTSDSKGSVDVRALQAELATLNDALDEADHSYEQLNEEKLALEEALGRLQEQISEPDDEALTQQSEEVIAALRAELELVREQAEADVSEMRAALKATEHNGEQMKSPVDSGAITALREELEQARLSIKEKELSSSADAAECEVLRQDIDKLKRSLDERSAELERARKEGLLLEEKTEERNSEIDRLKLALEAAQVDADEAQFKRDEALETRKQVEDALYKLQKQVESERPRDDLLDKRLASNAASYDTAPVSSGKRTFTGLVAGAVLAFAGAEALSILGGKGEIISGYLDGGESVVSAESPVSDSIVQNESVIPAIETPLSLPAEVSSVVEIKKQPDPQPVIKEPASIPVVPPVIVRNPPEPVKKAPPKSREPETGSRIQDRLFDGGSGPEMRYVRGGAFDMGSRVNHLASEEQPVHEVKLGSFSIGQHEVSFREYEVFAAATGRPLPDDLGWGQGPRPVINVSWNDAKAYTVWLTEQTGHNYRLPTEAEWEYAAAAGTDTPYWWGFDLGSGKANCFNCGSQWDGVSTAPVGRFEANPYGLHNTAGNVMEWVDDCYHFSYVGAPSDGSSWQEAGCTERVIRGGAFNKPGESLRVTKRGRHDANAKLFVLGFRVARDVR